MSWKLGVAGVALFFASLWGTAFVLHAVSDGWIIFPVIVTGLVGAVGGIFAAVFGFITI